MKKFICIFLFAAIPLMSASVGSLKGTVFDAKTGKGLSGVSVKVSGPGSSASTDSKGRYHIKKIPEGTYTVVLSRSGYAVSKQKGIKVKKNQATILNVKLLPVKADWKSTAEHSIEELMKKQPVNDKTDEKTSKEPALDPSNTITKAPAGESNVTTSARESDDDSESSLSKPSSSGSGSVTDPPETSGTSTPLMTRPSITITDESMESLEDEPASRPDVELYTPSISPPAIKFLSSGISGKKAEVTPSKTRPKQSSGLKAGYADDNQQFNYFLNFLDKYKSSVESYPYDIGERIHVILSDANEKSIPNAKIEIYDTKRGKLLDQGKTYSDGSFFIYPSEMALKDNTFYLSYTVDNATKTVKVLRYGSRIINIKTKQARQELPQVAVDIVFILDTTGSMGEEIKRLLETIDIIHMNLMLLPNQPLLRFGMVLYRDKEDKYRTRTIPLTSDIEEFRKALEKVKAGGGGDTAEDLQAALEKTLVDMDWNENGLRMGFVITDAHPHLDYNQYFTYIKAALEAKQKGIKLFTVGTGGLGLRGEYVLRQISQLTYAKYLFLTYGEETGENAGGRAMSVSHHTGSNYQTDKLEAIIMRMAREEISHFSDEPMDFGEDYFEAEAVDFETREETLAQLFKDAVDRLIDYSTLKLENASKLGVLPIHASTEDSELSAEYFLEQVQLSVVQNNQFVLIARKDLQAVLDEQKLQLSGLLTEDETTRIGELMGAELLLVGELYQKEAGYNLFLKLIRVETAEILAVTKIVIDKDLGL